MTGLAALVDHAQHWLVRHWPALATGAFFAGILGYLVVAEGKQEDQTLTLGNLDSGEVDEADSLP